VREVFDEVQKRGFRPAHILDEERHGLDGDEGLHVDPERSCNLLDWVGP